MIKLSDPIAYKKHAQAQELTNWLSHHNTEIAAKHKKRAKGVEYTRELLDGFKFDTNPKSKIVSLINFVSTPNEVVGPEVATKTLPTLREQKALRVGDSVEKVLRHRINQQNYKAGINPVTLMTAHRRKIILQALTNSDENINETREFSISKLNDYLSEKEGGENDDDIDDSMDFGELGSSITMKNRANKAYQGNSGLLLNTEAHRMNDNFNKKSLNSNSFDSESSKTSLKSTDASEDEDTFSVGTKARQPRDSSMRSVSHSVSPSETSSPFLPKWKAYDTMKVRWGYIQPQVKQLNDLGSVDAPHSGDVSNLYLKGDGADRIYGNVQDLHHYQTLMQNRPKRQQKIFGNTSTLAEKAEAKRNEIYRPQHYVKY